MLTTPNSVFGRILPGWIGDKFGRFNVMIVTTYTTVLFTLALWIPGKSDGALIAYAALFGFTSGTFVAMVPALVAQVTKDVRKIGVRNGTNFFIIAVAALTGNPIAGALIAYADGGYVYLQTFAGITMFIGASFFVVARYTQVGFKMSKV
jgi:MFS family permease